MSVEAYVMIDVRAFDIAFCAERHGREELVDGRPCTGDRFLYRRTDSILPSHFPFQIYVRKEPVIFCNNKRCSPQLACILQSDDTRRQFDRLIDCRL